MLNCTGSLNFTGFYTKNKFTFFYKLLVLIIKVSCVFWNACNVCKYIEALSEGTRAVRVYVRAYACVYIIVQVYTGVRDNVNVSVYAMNAIKLFFYFKKFVFEHVCIILFRIKNISYYKIHSIQSFIIFDNKPNVKI